jgi:hypothetical protein
VLTADSDAAALERYRTLLAAADYEVSEATDGRETREAELRRAVQAGADAVIKHSTSEVLFDTIERLQHRPRQRAMERSLACSDEHRRPLVKTHLRGTTRTPETPPPHLCCPICYRVLAYRETYVGGVNQRHPERWDYYDCSTCGGFQYRHRTRKLRQSS